MSDIARNATATWHGSAAHAACFNMVVAMELSERGSPPEKLTTRATVTLEKHQGSYEISAVHLERRDFSASFHVASPWPTQEVK